MLAFAYWSTLVHHRQQKNALLADMVLIPVAVLLNMVLVAVAVLVMLQLPQLGWLEVPEPTAT